MPTARRAGSRRRSLACRSLLVRFIRRVYLCRERRRRFCRNSTAERSDKSGASEKKKTQSVRKTGMVISTITLTKSGRRGESEGGGRGVVKDKDSHVTCSGRLRVMKGIDGSHFSASLVTASRITPRPLPYLCRLPFFKGGHQLMLPRR